MKYEKYVYCCDCVDAVDVTVTHIMKPSLLNYRCKYCGEILQNKMKHDMYNTKTKPGISYSHKRNVEKDEAIKLLRDTLIEVKRILDNQQLYEATLKIQEAMEKTKQYC